MGIFQARILEWVTGPPSEDLPNPGIEPVSPALQADSLLAELPGKNKRCVQQYLIMPSTFNSKSHPLSSLLPVGHHCLHISAELTAQLA